MIEKILEINILTVIFLLLKKGGLLHGSLPSVAASNFYSKPEPHQNDSAAQQSLKVILYFCLLYL
jgi:hypothetical protein